LAASWRALWLKGKANITIRTLLNILAIHNYSIEDFFELKVNEDNDNKKTNQNE
jgi:hypothetical protein